MGWGANLPEGIKEEDCVCTWGARAIYTLCYKPGATTYRRGKRVQKSGKTVVDIDILPDRQNCSNEFSSELIEWLNVDAGFSRFKKLAEAAQLPTSSGESIELRDGKFGIRGTPNGSYGYMYIKAWQLKGEVPDVQG